MKSSLRLGCQDQRFTAPGVALLVARVESTAARLQPACDGRFKSVDRGIRRCPYSRPFNQVADRLVRRVHRLGFARDKPLLGLYLIEECLYCEGVSLWLCFGPSTSV